jgi:hypothetical protein
MESCRQFGIFFFGEAKKMCLTSSESPEGDSEGDE